MKDAAHGSIEMLRETVIEQLHLTAWRASLAVDQGSVTADAGMVYNTKRAVAHLRMATDVLKLMHEYRQREAARRAEQEGAAVTLGLEAPEKGA